MSDSPELRTDAPIPVNEVFMVIVTPGEPDPDGPPDTIDIKAVACAYDLNKGPLNGARQLDSSESSEDFGEFVSEVMGDMVELTSNTIYSFAMDAKRRENVTEGDERTAAVREADRTRMRGEMYLKLLMFFGDKPVELLGNVTATFLVSCIEDVIDSPDYEARVANWLARVNAPTNGGGVT